MQKKKIIKKSVSEKHVRVRNSVKIRMNVVDRKNVVIETIDDLSDNRTGKNENTVNKSGKKSKVNNNKNNSDMNDVDIISDVKKILNNDELPERKTKKMKKDKGLYERTSESTILITEDNKIMLTD